jgi:protoporphyrinogen/coproporphyrinogen III oxidase
MNSHNSGPIPTVVIGGGISGLATAHRLVELDRARPLRLLEASPRVGGVLETTSENGFLREAAADGFHGPTSRVRTLCEQLGLGDEILYAAPLSKPFHVVHRGQLVSSPVALLSGTPPSVRSIVSTPLLSWRSKCRMFGERWVAPNHADDESCASFFIRRFGAEFYSRLVEPVLSGVYSADPATLSMQALLPQIREMEQRRGSLTAAFRQRVRSAGAGTRESDNGGLAAWTLRSGMSSLTKALTAALPAGSVEVNAAVHRVRSNQDRTWHIDYGRGQALQAAAVVLATPAHHTAHLLETTSSHAARLLQHISYSSVAVLALGYHRTQICGPLNSPGIFVPEVEPFELRSASFTSIKYAGRAPADAILIRASLGGPHHAWIVGQSDAELIQLADQELSRLLKIQGGPVFARVQRQLFALPQYRLGHRQLIDTVRRHLAEFPGLALAGNAYSGIGVPACIASGQQAAEQVHRYLTATPASSAASAAAPFMASTQTEPTHA